MRAILLLTVLGMGACTAGTGDTGTPATGFSDTTGNIFKGPMSAGSTVTVQPLDDQLRPVGDPVTAEVDDDSGAYELTIQHEGLVLITAQGEVMDESRGEVYGPPVELKAYGRVTEGQSQLYVNVITDLTNMRIATLLGQGLDFDEAIEQSQREFSEAFSIGVDDPPEERGESLNPYGDGFAQSYLFAVSAVIAQAGRDLEEQGVDMGGLLVDVREDFGEDAHIDSPFLDVMRIAETRMDPDLAALGLESLLSSAGLDLPRPNLHPALDTDQDGVANDRDNCRYVANPDQIDSESRGFGDDCDFRLAAILTTDHWGCGILPDGSLTWWQVDAPPSGGSPPRPDVFPNAPFAPWGEDEYPLTDAYSTVGIGDELVCGLSATDGSVDCWTGGGPAVSLPGTFVDLAVSPELVCARTALGSIECVGSAGVVHLPGPYADFALAGDDAVCGVSSVDGQIDCQHADGTPVSVGLSESFSSVAGSSEGPVWGCAITSSGGYVRCFGDSVLVDSAPTGGGFTEVAVGTGVACAAKADGTLSCWRDEQECGGEGAPPPAATGLSAEDCTVCGIEPNGLGACWPRFWDREHPE